MQDRSKNEAESKENPSGSQAAQPIPTFKARLVLDAFSGVFCDRRGWAHLLLRTVDGQEFECFIDGIVAKGFSDRLLGLAGNLILQSHGESQDLRPLHELDDDDADEERAIPKGIPAMAPQPMPAPGGKDDPGTLAKPPQFATALPISGFDHTMPMPEDIATVEFLQTFASVTDDELTNAITRKAIREGLQAVDPKHPEVQKMRKRLAAFLAEES